MTERSSGEAADSKLSALEPAPDASESFAGFLRDAAQVSIPAEAPLELREGSVLAGKFRIERCLGAGGMGAVYAVRHELTRHRRALKLLHAERSARPDLVRRFLAEASAAGRVGSPHLVETFDAGTLPSGEPYLVMELLEGSTFGELLARKGQLDAGLACELVAQAAEGMDAAHRAGIVHRDLKPDNLFILQREHGPFVKVLDFGISKFNTESLAHTGATQVGVIFGTPAYMAPEQYRSAADADPRADVFALGAVLFECLGGVAPYDAPSIHAIGARLMTGQYTPLETLRSDLDPALVKLVHQAIAADLDQRIPSAPALVAALAPFRNAQEARVVSAFPRARGEPTAADSAVPELARPRSRLREVVVAIVALGVCGVLVLLAWQRSSDAGTSPARPAPTVRPAVSAVPVPTVNKTEESSSRHAQIAAPIEPHATARPAPHTTGATKTRLQAAPDAAVPRSRASQLGLSERNPFR